MAAAVRGDDVDGRAEERVAIDRGLREHHELHRPLVGVVAGQVGVAVTGGVEDAPVATRERVHSGPGLVAEGDDPGRRLDRVGQRADARRRRPV